MKPGPQLHRSLTFWAGLIIILFTCWAWWDSRSHMSLLRWKQFGIDSTLSGLGISRIPSFNDPLQFKREDRGTGDDEELFGPFDPPFLVRAKPEPEPTSRSHLELNQQHVVNLYGPGSWSLYLPYWLILPPLLLTWTALLLFRARRHRRAKLLQIQ